MGFFLKSSKCRSLSICSGQVQDVTFVIKDYSNDELKVPIETVHNRPHKFLGSQITYSNTPQEYFKHFQEVLKTKLENIEESKVRGEYKLSIYERYALPSMRFHFSIHDMHQSHLEKLDMLSQTYLKKWLNYPKRGVTNVGLFHPYLLNVKQPSQMYLEGHTSNLMLMTLKGDQTVKACIESKLKRESKWKKKSSSIVKSKRIIVDLVAKNKIQIPTSQTTLQQNIKIAKVAIKKSIQEQTKEAWNERVQRLTMQGDFTNLLIEEESSVMWQSMIRRMPRNVLSFATRLCTNSLNSPDNLVRWGKKRIGSCPLCSSTSGTLAHIVNFCPIALKQGRYTWRHDSVLLHTTKMMKSLATENTEVFSDLEGYRVNGTTIPADILVSVGKGSRPDLVLLDRKKKVIALLELTVPLPRNTQAANTRKVNTYTPLEIALRERGYKVHLVPFEICSNGHVSKRNKQNIENVLRKFNMRLKVKLLKDLSQISLLCTMAVFYAYQVTDWVDPPLLSPLG